jgi:hypothetical protein
VIVGWAVCSVNVGMTVVEENDLIVVLFQVKVLRSFK